jgi:hypothetical protein
VVERDEQVTERVTAESKRHGHGDDHDLMATCAG